MPQMDHLVSSCITRKKKKTCKEQKGSATCFLLHSLHQHTRLRTSISPALFFQRFGVGDQSLTHSLSSSKLTLPPPSLKHLGSNHYRCQGGISHCLFSPPGFRVVLKRFVFCIFLCMQRRVSTHHIYSLLMRLLFPVKNMARNGMRVTLGYVTHHKIPAIRPFHTGHPPTNVFFSRKLPICRPLVIGSLCTAIRCLW